MENTDLHKELELCRLISENDEGAFNELYQLYLPVFSPYVFKLVKSQEAVKEVIQESLIKFWIYRDKLFEVEEPRAWFFRIIANECFRYLRDNGLHRSRVQQMAGEQQGIHMSANQTAMDISFRETQKIISEALARLSPRQRSIYSMSRESGLTLPEIAKQLNVSRDYVKKTLMTALQKIRQKLIDGDRITVIFWLLKFFFDTMTPVYCLPGLYIN